MQVTFLGTSAANAFPEAFCLCENCRGARALGGRSLRKRSSILINEDLLIDLGPDIMAAAQMHARPLTGVLYCLQTHAHADHLDVSHLLSRSPEYGVVGAPRLHIFASAATLGRMALLLEGDLVPATLFQPQTAERLNLEVHAVESLRPFQIGPYRVTAYPANHDPSVQSLLYAVEGQGRSIFYGVDTAELPEETWRGFHDHQVRFDLVILDHTYGPHEQASDHLNAQQVEAHVERMRREGLLTPQALALATHIAHQGNPPHPQLQAYAEQHGYQIAYDGLTV